MSDQEQSTQTPPTSEQHRTASIPESYTSPLGNDNQRIENVEGHTGNLIGDGETPGGASETADGPGDQSAPPDPETTTTTQPADPQLQDKAAAYEWLMSDPQLGDMIRTTVRQRHGMAPQPNDAPQTPPEPDAAEYVSRREYEELQGTLKNVLLRMGANELDKFKAVHQDFDAYEADVGQLMRDYGLPLEKAYPLAKVLKNGGTLPAARQTTVAPAEAGPGGGGQRTSKPADPLEEIQGAISRLPQGPRRFDSAVDLTLRRVINEAMKQ